MLYENGSFPRMISAPSLTSGGCLDTLYAAVALTLLNKLNDISVHAPSLSMGCVIRQMVNEWTHGPFTPRAFPQVCATQPKRPSALPVPPQPAGPRAPGPHAAAPPSPACESAFSRGKAKHEGALRRTEPWWGSEREESCKNYFFCRAVSKMPLLRYLLRSFELWLTCLVYKLCSRKLISNPPAHHRIPPHQAIHLWCTKLKLPQFVFGDIFLFPLAHLVFAPMDWHYECAL